MITKSYSFKSIEEKWQNIWKEKNIFLTNNVSFELPKYYILEMFPYPSGKIHMGHVRNYTLGDVIARYKKSKGFNVLHPMGWDAFGLPAENAAKEHNIHPMKWTYSNIEEMKKHFFKLGFSIDWSREVITCSPQYYKYEQQIFIELFKNNLSYRKESWVNWDPIENTVLANEQVIDGKGWRSGAIVEQKKLHQWFLRITDFAEDLLQDIKMLENWPDKVKNMQHNWIGKSEGMLIKFKVINKDNILEIYSTKAYTIYGASFIALSVYHPLSIELATQNNEIDSFIKEVHKAGTIEENLSKEEKKGINTKLFAINPLTLKELPIFIANYVLDYGGGAIFGCPAHDERDFEFAKKYNLPIINVINNDNDKNKPFLGDGLLTNSGILDNLNIEDAKLVLENYLNQNNIGYKKINYRLKDWGVSRQRYWGAPIPIIYCDNCGVVPEIEANLPIELPIDVDFSQEGNPLANHPTWKHTKCPHCGLKAIRETDTFDTFFESSWYFLKYASFSDNFFDDIAKKDISYWLPVDQYIGGIEHAVMHLLYSRFFTKALEKINFINPLKEPFVGLMTQGMISHKTYKNEFGWVFPEDVIEDKGILVDKNLGLPVIIGKSEKMSKSKKNIVDPSYICSIYGADTARLFVLSDSPPQKDLEWSDEGVESAYKFINRFWNFVIENYKILDSQLIINNLHEKELVIYKYTQTFLYNLEKNINDFHFNKAIALCRELFNYLSEHKVILLQKQDLFNYSLEILVQCLGFFIPHIAEELWSIFGKKELLYNNPFPTIDAEYLVKDIVSIAVQISGKTRGFIEVEPNISQDDLISKIKVHHNIAKYLQNTQIKKVIYVPKKIINLVC